MTPDAPRTAPGAPRVLGLLVAAAGGAAAGLPLVSAAPNRLLSGQGVRLTALLQAEPAGWTASAALLALGLVLGLAMLWRRPAQRAGHLLVLAALGSGLLWLLALAGRHAAAADRLTEGLGRTTPASGFWLAALLLWLAAHETLRRLRAPALAVTAGWALLWLALLALTASGALDALSALKEYAERADDFWRALREHLRIIGITALLTLGTGLPLGVALHRHPRWAARVFPLLSLVQTIPSVALFGVLMGLLPALGLRGVGLAPAVLALTAYSLLPLVRSTCEGLAQLPRAVTESATAMGLSRRQLLWQVELPLALPVLLAGLKVMLIQTIGLTAVAALIGAGGLGALMFEGLFSSALDLVVLAVVPMVALAWLAEGLFVAAGALVRRWAQG